MLLLILHFLNFSPVSSNQTPSFYFLLRGIPLKMQWYGQEQFLEVIPISRDLETRLVWLYIWCYKSTSSFSVFTFPICAQLTLDNNGSLLLTSNLQKHLKTAAKCIPWTIRPAAKNIFFFAEKGAFSCFTKPNRTFFCLQKNLPPFPLKLGIGKVNFLPKWNVMLNDSIDFCFCTQSSV